jgi:N4-gp56 family major capsid protein
MTYTPHLKVKPQVLIQAAVSALNDTLSISNTVTKRNDLATFFKAEGDTISQRVKGTVPVRQYTPRNDRSQPIITDNYQESVVTVTISAERPYSAIKMTDEQADWDFTDGWQDIIEAQTNSIASYLEHGVLNQILQAPYERVIIVKDDAPGLTAAQDANQDVWYNAIIEAKKALRLMRTPNDTLYAICGLDFEEKIMKSNRFLKDQGTGDNALTSSTLGSIAGVRFISTTQIPADEAYLYASSGFLAFTGVPRIPRSVPFGAAASAGGWALRFLMDYDTAYLTDRSVFDCYAGYSYVKDRVSVFDGRSNELISPDEYFVRGVKLALKSTSSAVEKAPGDGKTDTPGGPANSFLGKVYKQQTVTAAEVIGEPFPLGGNYPGAKAGATATLTKSGSTVGSITVTAPGFGYTSTPAVTISGGSGTGATAVAVIQNGQVISVEVTAAGTGYTGTPTVAIAAP